MDLRSHFVGALLGTMIGDQLGAPFEGQSAETIALRFCTAGRSPAEWIRDSQYTDDTQMMIGLAESLASLGHVDESDLARRFVENYEPYRGYGGGTHQVIAALRSGISWQKAATLAFPQGSFGNGAAMRVAPVGAFYHADATATRRTAAERSAQVTHAHPLGIEGAVLQAHAVAEAIRSAGSPFDPAAFIDRISADIRSDGDEYTRSLARARALLDSLPSADEVTAALGCDVRAHRSVPTAVYAFAAHWASFSDAVLFAVSLGGDTDTIGAMTGAIAGAYHGLEGIPSDWIDALEDCEKGREYVIALAARLGSRHQE
ncbi:MAG: ADP-ribosylglycohydrolase family protein [Phycisphaerales bacterium]|nr:ADP-ribosylglycohydrolase family protein [Phycisphaerales bacterium]